MLSNPSYKTEFVSILSDWKSEQSPYANPMDGHLFDVYADRGIHIVLVRQRTYIEGNQSLPYNLVQFILFPSLADRLYVSCR